MKGPNKTRLRSTATIFGTNARVGSWIDVTVWKTLTSKPTARPVRSGGAELNMIARSPSRIRSRIVSCVKGSTPKT
jgi:hypothetical protein